MHSCLVNTGWVLQWFVVLSANDRFFLKRRDCDTHKHQFTSFCRTVSHKHRLSGSLLNILNANFQKNGPDLLWTVGENYFSNSYLPLRRQWRKTICQSEPQYSGLLTWNGSSQNIWWKVPQTSSMRDFTHSSVSFLHCSTESCLYSASLQQRNYDTIITKKNKIDVEAIFPQKLLVNFTHNYNTLN